VENCAPINDRLFARLTAKTDPPPLTVRACNRKGLQERGEERP